MKWMIFFFVKCDQVPSWLSLHYFMHCRILLSGRNIHKSLGKYLNIIPVTVLPPFRNAWSMSVGWVTVSWQEPVCSKSWLLFCHPHFHILSHKKSWHSKFQQILSNLKNHIEIHTNAFVARSPSIVFPSWYFLVFWSSVPGVFFTLVLGLKILKINRHLLPQQIWWTSPWPIHKLPRQQQVFFWCKSSTRKAPLCCYRYVTLKPQQAILINVEFNWINVQIGEKKTSHSVLLVVSLPFSTECLIFTDPNPTSFGEEEGGGEGGVRTSMFFFPCSKKKSWGSFFHIAIPH